MWKKCLKLQRISCLINEWYILITALINERIVNKIFLYFWAVGETKSCSLKLNELWMKPRRKSLWSVVSTIWNTSETHREHLQLTEIQSSFHRPLFGTRITQFVRSRENFPSHLFKQYGCLDLTLFRKTKIWTTAVPWELGKLLPSWTV